MGLQLAAQLVVLDDEKFDYDRALRLLQGGKDRREGSRAIDQQFQRIAQYVGFGSTGQHLEVADTLGRRAGLEYLQPFQEG